MYIDKLDNIVNECNNTYNRTIKMKPVEVKDNAYIDFSKEVNGKNSKFKAGDHVRISGVNSLNTVPNLANFTTKNATAAQMYPLFWKVFQFVKHNLPIKLLLLLVMGNLLLITFSAFTLH